MSKHFGNTEKIGVWLARLQAGENEARSGLIEEAYERLRRLASKMLKGHQELKDAIGLETGDVLHSSMLSLLGTFDEIEFQSPRHFINLAAQKMRFRLIDLARKHKIEIQARRHSDIQDCAAPPPIESVAVEASGFPEPETLEEWAAVHEAVEHLPEIEKEIVNSIVYVGRTQQETATMLNVSKKSVQRKYQSALRLLQAALSRQSL